MLYDKNKLVSELQNIVNYFSEELKQINAGKPNIDVINNIDVDAYGSKVKLNTVGQVVVDDAVSVKVNVWDKSIIQAVEQGLRNADLGASVAVESNFIRLKFNPITGEDREKRVKELNKKLEDYKVRVRLVRQKFIKEVEDKTGVSEDEQERDTNDIQKTIDENIKKLEELSEKKEKDLTSI